MIKLLKQKKESKMIIGVDIDGVLIDIYSFMLKTGKKHIKKVGKYKLVNKNAYETCEMFNWSPEYDDNVFWKEYLVDYCKNSPAMPKAQHYLQKLKEQGHKIVIVTSRTNNPQPQLMKTLAINWLTQNNIPHDDIAFCQKTKTQQIKEYGVQVMIEDKPQHILEISQLIPTINFVCPYNKHVKGNQIYQAKNWKQVYNFIQKINTTH